MLPEITTRPVGPDLPALADATRRDFPLLARQIDGNRITYLDNAATSLTPRQVMEAMNRFYAEVGANIHRGKHLLSEQASNDYEDVRLQVAELTGFRGNEVVFTANTTASLNLVAGGLPLATDDLVLLPADGHHSALLPWRRRARVRYIPVDDRGVVDLDHYAKLLRARPRVVVLNHCSNVTGLYIPVEGMAELAKAAGAVTVVDAAQSIGHRPVGDPHIDFLAFSAHKMLGPTGLGVLCGRYDVLSTLEPLWLGGGTVDWVDRERYQVRKLPHRLEAGTPDIAGVYGLAAAIRYLTGIGFDRLRAHDLALGSALVEAARDRPYLRLLGAVESPERAAILSVTMPGLHLLKEVAGILSDSYGVMCRTGHMCAQPFVDQLTDNEVLRISGYLYNDADDVARLFSALDEIIPSLGLGPVR